MTAGKVNRRRGTGEPESISTASAVVHDSEVAALHGGDPPADTFACEVQALLEAYFGSRVLHAEARRLIVLAVRLRQAWQAAECRCVERHEPAKRPGTPERAAAEAYRRAMARLIEAARELSLVPMRQ